MRPKKKRLWSVRTVDDWQDWYNEIDIQQCLTILWISVLEHQQVSVCDLFNRPSFIWFSEPSAYSCTDVDYTVQSFTSRMDPSTHPPDCWWLHDLYDDCIQVACLITYTYSHSCSLRIWTDLDNSICTVPHPTRRELTPRGSLSILLTLGTSIGHLNHQTQTLLRIFGLSCNLPFRRDVHSCGFVYCPSGFLVWIASRIHSDISRVHATSCCGTSACSWGVLHYIRHAYQFFWHLSMVL